MSTMKIDQILRHCCFSKIIKRPGTNFQSPALTQKYVRNVCHFILVVLRIQKKSA